MQYVYENLADQLLYLNTLQAFLIFPISQECVEKLINCISQHLPVVYIPRVHYVFFLVKQF